MDWPPPEDWPFAGVSERIRCGALLWHVQQIGSGPEILLLHGAGGATHGWRDLAPILARDWRVVMLDLPGHGFTRSATPSRAGLGEMTEDLHRLIAQQAWQPVAILGHSAGAAVGLNLVATAGPGGAAGPMVIGINPALAPFDGVAGWLFPALARLLALNPLVPLLFSLGASPDRARRLIEGTGSALSPEGYRLYARLLADRAHVNGALQMMARWTLDPLLERLPDLSCPVRFITGARDRAVPPEVAETAARALPDARVIRMDRAGHLAHEEDAPGVAALIAGFLAEPGAAPRAREA